MHCPRPFSMHRAFTLLPLCLTSLLVITTMASAQPSEDGWWTDYTAARQYAQQNNLPLLLNFTGSDWCLWCQRLEAGLFANEAFIKALNTNLVAVRLDFPRRTPLPLKQQRQNRALAEQFQVATFPTVLWITPHAKKPLHRHSYVDLPAHDYLHALQELTKSSKE